MKCRIVFPFIFIQMGVHKLNEKERKKSPFLQISLGPSSYSSRIRTDEWHLSCQLMHETGKKILKQSEGKAEEFI